MTWFRNAVAVTLVLASTMALAHSPPRPDPRFGGRVVIANRLHLELVVAGDVATLHVLDTGRAYLRVSVDEAQATVFWPDGIERIELKSEGRGALLGAWPRREGSDPPKVFLDLMIDGRRVHATLRAPARTKS